MSSCYRGFALAARTPGGTFVTLSACSKRQSRCLLDYALGWLPNRVASGDFTTVVAPDSGFNLASPWGERKNSTCDTYRAQCNGSSADAVTSSSNGGPEKT